MAKKTVLLSDEVEELQDLSPEEQDVLAALNDLEGSQDARWQVTREAPGNGKPEGYLDTLSTSEVRMDEIKRRFGRGNYKVKGLRADGTYLKQLRFKIALDPETAPAIPTAPVSDTKDILSLMQDREEKRAERSRELMMAVIPGAIATLGGIITAVMSRPAQQNNVLQDIATLKAVIGPPPQHDTPMEMMVKMLELGKKFGDGKGGDSWLDVVKEAISTAGPILMEKLGPPPAPAGGAGQHPSPAQLSAPNPYLAAPQAPQGADMRNPLTLLHWAREKLTYLTTKAAKNSDAGIYVDWLIDDVPEGIDIREFAQYLEHEKWWQYLQQMSPSVAPYQGWFSEFRDLLLDAVTEMYQGPEATAPIETKPEDFQEPQP